MIELKTLTIILLWIIAFIGGTILYKRLKLSKQGSSGKDSLTIIKAIHTGPKDKIFVVQCNDSCYLISNTPVSSTLLDKWPASFCTAKEEQA